MRFFIALEIPDENIAQFQSIQQSLNTLIPQAKFTALDKIHLTLAFIGEQDDLLKDKLSRLIQSAVSQIAPFEVTPAYLDGFPNLHHPQVLWVGVKGEIDKIFMIHERIKDGLKELNLPVDERRFIPHISIAKLNNNLEIEGRLEVDLERIMAIDLQPILISSIKLIESIPQEHFHTHNTLAEIHLL